MRVLLQYFYSIGVFCSVLITAYIILDKEGNTRVSPRPADLPVARVDATAVDPALMDLLSIENELRTIPKSK